MMQRVFLIFFLLKGGDVIAQQPFSSDLTGDAIRKVANSVADWQIRHHSQGKYHKLNWTNGAFYIGLVKWADQSRNERYFNFLDSLGKTSNWGLLDRVYHADDICVGQTYLELYKEGGGKEKIQPLLERAFYVASHPDTAPLSKKDPVGRDTRWSWCDALFMAPPVYASLYALTGEQVYLEYLNNEFKVSVDSLFDQEDHLFYRDNLRIGVKESNGAKQFWGRGNGWVFAGLPLIIDNLPADEPSRQYYMDLFKEMAQAILRTQDRQGAWHASLLDTAAYPAPENSASAFLCYGLAWGIRNNLLDKREYGEALEMGWKSLVSYVNEEGRLGYIQAVGANPQAVSADATDVYGVGAFLLAASELYRSVQEANRF